MKYGDLISRQEAIDALSTWDKFGVDERGRIVRWRDGLEPYVKLRDVITAIVNTPSEQPEIIRCKECKYGVVDDPEIPTLYFCEHNGQDLNDEYHYCGYAERREVRNERFD